jgi:hypothetical protein
MMEFTITRRGISISLPAIDLGFLCSAIAEAWEAAKGGESEFLKRTADTHEFGAAVGSRLRAIERECRHEEEPESDEEDERISVLFSLCEPKFLRNAIRETLDGVEEWEFQTRTGETLVHAKEILDQLVRMLDVLNG